jgi:hypothetical protein
MRTSLKCLAVLGGSAAVLALSGCFSGSNPPPDMDAAMEPDTGSNPDSTTPLPDAPAPEAGHDATADTYVAEAAVEAAAPEASVDAGPPPVTVVVTSALGPEQGVSVVFQDAFNQIIATVTTDATGRASAFVPVGSEITAYMGNVAAPRLVTIEGVVPGDVLGVYDTSSDGNLGTFTVDLAPDAAAPPGTSALYGYAGDCSFSGTGSVASLQSGDCVSQGKFPVVLFADGTTDAGYGRLAYTYSKGNPVATDGGNTSVVMPGPWYTALGSQTITATNVDAGVGMLGPYGWTGVADEITGGVPTPSSTNIDFTADASVGVELHPGFADSLQAELNFIQYSGATNSQSVTAIVTNPAGDAGTTTFDMGQVLPLIDQVSFAKPSRVLTWGSEAGTLPVGDGVLASLEWGDTTDAGVTVQGTWTIVAPPGVRTVTLPAAPPALATLAPSSTASFYTPTVAIVDADFIAGYDQLRVQAGALPLSKNLVQGRYGNQSPPLPVDGTLRLTAITQAGD